MKRMNGPYQYEPLVTPEGWKDAERRFAIRLTQLLDELFDRVGRMERQISAMGAGEKEEENG